MTREEIKEIHEAIEQRGLVGTLKARLKIMRPKISADTIARAWEVQNYNMAPGALRLVLSQARFVKEADDKRIEQELSELTREMVGA